MYGPSPRAVTPIIHEKNWFLFITVCQLSVLQYHRYLFSPEKLTIVICHHCRFYSFHSAVTPLFPACCYVAKFAGPLVVAALAVVQPNMLNMPKSASVNILH